MALTRRTFIFDEGSSQGAVTSINFIGAGVAASASGGTGTASVAAGGTGGSLTIFEAEVDFVATPRLTGTFTITNTDISAGSKILTCRSGAAPTGSTSDEVEMDPVVGAITAGTGVGTLTVVSPTFIAGKHKFLYTIG